VLPPLDEVIEDRDDEEEGEARQDRLEDQPPGDADGLAELELEKRREQRDLVPDRDVGDVPPRAEL
jgi:hypothetical protein